jgi:molybdenum cofactor guanylyltransferase
VNARLGPVESHDRVESVTAFVLAGGRSSRMGADKALLQFGNSNLLQIALDKAKRVCSQPIIVGDRRRYSAYGPVIEDRFPGCGPLGGIHAALRETYTDLNVVVSVDTPLMIPEFLLWLVQSAAAGSETVTVPESDGKPQPLCAVYRRALLPVIESALKAGELKVTGIFSAVSTRTISEAELRAAGFPPEIFYNVNTPAEYETARDRAARVLLEASTGARR